MIIRGTADDAGGLVLVKHWHVDDSAADFPAYDGTGNVRGLFRSDNGTIETYCSYDPFGQGFAYNRSPAAPNPFGYSTRYTDNETGLVYFGYRYYDPETGRWLSRDPIQEWGGVNLYGYVGNDPVNCVDYLGLWNLWNPLTWGVGNGAGDPWYNSLAPWSDNAYWDPTFHGLAEGLPQSGLDTLNGLSDIINVPSDVPRSQLEMERLSWSKDMVVPSNTYPYEVTKAAGGILAGGFLGSIASKACALGSAGADMVASEQAGAAENGMTVLGKYPDYVRLADEIGARRFSIPADVWNRMSAAEQWAANQKFLDRLIMRGDNIILSNPVRNLNDVSGAFRAELDYMIGNGYRLSEDGTRLIQR